MSRTTSHGTGLSIAAQNGLSTDTDGLRLGLRIVHRNECFNHPHVPQVGADLDTQASADVDFTVFKASSWAEILVHIIED
jgi:hypothetical protein